jgi:hypothetical protein
MSTYSLTLLPGRYAVCLLPPTAPPPVWASGGDFVSITRTSDELSIICSQAALPAPLPDHITVARDWVLLRVEGPFAFDVTGVLAALSATLAQAGVVTLAVATYQTDYLLVKMEQLSTAMQALTTMGHSLTSISTPY